MTDESVHAALRSEAALVVVEAPGGCGKTFQGSDYAKDIAAAIKPGRLLILTHTHAACSIFDKKTKGIGSNIEIRTIDSLIAQIASAYHRGLALPADASVWARQAGDDGYGLLGVKVAALLKRYPSIAAALAQRYPLIVCDEHQDCSGEQHAVIAAIQAGGARLRVFADPMQKIFKDKSFVGGCLPCDWNVLKEEADTFEELDVPHRWKNTDPDLGKWILGAREALKAGGKVDLVNRPTSVVVIRVDNIAKKYGDVLLSTAHRKPIDAFIGATNSLLVVAHHTRTASALRALFYRQIPLWEGHTRKGLEKLIGVLKEPQTTTVLAAAVVTFMDEVAVGFSPSAFGDQFQAEVAGGCTTKRKADTKPAKIQALAKLIVDEPDFRGVAKVLRTIGDLRASDSVFNDIKIDHSKEFWEAARLAEYSTAEEGFNALTHKRTYSRPSPPPKAISTIHKAKGLECDCVVLMACDDKQFPDTPEARCLLYVGLSRAMNRLMIVVPNSNPSPLLQL
ncbi:MAG: ATP-dependent helicase [Hyphomicrobium sp.]|uniref:ATP-dependent helicase n=1 Tax=Hyphomicrobium sp. TaxID=82 RepID=UPI0025C4C210|nr:ATP-dependent helicase [Hyphomicrobium sp.]MBX9862346.1 ATP-dependent helicase [Hyphomicrobium sp.]